MKKDAQKIRVFAVKGGVAKELHNLPEDIMLKLDRAYEETPIKGLSRDTYGAMIEFFGGRLVEYQNELTSDSEVDDMFAKTVAFARAFGISSDESPAFFDLMLRIERSIAEQPEFDSRSISMKNLKSLINKDWQTANKDFRQWARKLFEDTGLKIGIIRMTKFFYGVVTQLQVA